MDKKYDIWVKNGTDEYVVIPIKDYQEMCQRLEDDADYRALQASKRRQAGSAKTSLAQVKRSLGMARTRKAK